MPISHCERDARTLSWHEGCGCASFVTDDSQLAGLRPKLLDRVRQAIRLRHYSRRTEQAYVAWIRRFIVFNGKRHPRELGEPEVTAFLSGLAARSVSASTQNQALSAILFLYEVVMGGRLAWMDGIVRAQRPVRLPVVLSREEEYPAAFEGISALSRTAYPALCHSRVRCQANGTPGHPTTLNPTHPRDRLQPRAEYTGIELSRILVGRTPVDRCATPVKICGAWCE
jgi:Phage integrase, N-terminal SAM-like domain